MRDVIYKDEDITDLQEQGVVSSSSIFYMYIKSVNCLVYGYDICTSKDLK
jgi:hypothetical protein